jgi:hypothetical protein
MKRTIQIFLLLTMCGCSDEPARPAFVPTKYADDLTQDTLRQMVHSPLNKEFIGIFWKVRGLGGHKVLRLYSADSISIGELNYGEHPMEIVSWKNTLIVLNACIGSSIENSAYNRWYLDNSVDKNNHIGSYKLVYHKSYGCTQ